MEKKIKKTVRVTGRNWGELFGLPCVDRIGKHYVKEKFDGDRVNIVRDHVHLRRQSLAYPDPVFPDSANQYAFVGDTLIEYPSGKWDIERRPAPMSDDDPRVRQRRWD